MTFGFGSFLLGSGCFPSLPHTAAHADTQQRSSISVSQRRALLAAAGLIVASVCNICNAPLERHVSDRTL